MGYRVVFLPKARAELNAIGQWWATNCRESPRLFRHEARAALNRLREQPEIGEAIDGAPQAVRRVLLPRTRYYVYYQVARAARTVIVLSIWHTSRGSGPSL